MLSTLPMRQRNIGRTARRAQISLKLQENFGFHVLAAWRGFDVNQPGISKIRSN
jgi:hypothetical protein